MKNPIILVGIVIVIFLAVFTMINLGNFNQKDSNNLTWYYDVNYALQQAQMNNKTVILDFYSTSCDNCGNLDSVTFKDPPVNKKLKENYNIYKEPNKLQQIFSGDVFNVKYDVPILCSIAYTKLDKLEDLSDPSMIIKICQGWANAGVVFLREYEREEGTHRLYKIARGILKESPQKKVIPSL